MSCANINQETVSLSREDLLNGLKRKVLCEVETLTTRLGKGYRPDLDFILAEIYLIDMLSRSDSSSLDQDFSLYALQFYLNNAWRIQS